MGLWKIAIAADTVAPGHANGVVSVAAGDSFITNESAVHVGDRFV